MYNIAGYGIGREFEGRSGKVRAYIVIIAAAAVMSAAVNMLSPEKWQKYISVVTGLVMALCIGRPIFAMLNTDIFEGIKYETKQNEADGQTRFATEVKKELEHRIAEDVKNRLKREFGAECDAEADVSVNSAGQISGVNSITVYGGGIDNAAIGRLREVYGAKSVRINRGGR